MRTSVSSIAVACGLIAMAVAAAPPALAGNFGDPLTKQDKSIILRPADLTGSARHPQSVTSLQWGNDTAPTGCVRLDDGASVGNVAPRAIYRDIKVNRKLSWQNAIFEYTTAADAQASFDALRQHATAACNASKRVNQTADGDRTPVAVTTSTREGAGAGGRPHVVVESSEVLVDPAHAPKLARSLYGLHEFVLAGTGIVDVTIWQQTPMSARQRAQAAALSDVVAARYIASQ